MATLTREGTMLAYEDAGEGEPALVLVHGAASHRAFMAPQAEYLRASHRVIAVELRGHGDTDAPPQRYTIGALVDDVGWMCERLEVAPAVVVGHSLGGLVALKLAPPGPTFVRTAVLIVLIDSVLLPEEGREHAVARLVAGLRGPDPEGVLRDYFRSSLVATTTSPCATGSSTRRFVRQLT